MIIDNCEMVKWGFWGGDFGFVRGNGGKFWVPDKKSFPEASQDYDGLNTKI